jgi:hypothetical protein
MNSAQAKKILTLYRVGIDDPHDPEVVEALALAQTEPELGQWWRNQSAVYAATREKFKQIAVPEGLQQQILTSPKRAASRWSWPVIWAAAAAIILFLALYRPSPPVERSFAAYRARMVRTAMGNYPMPLLTNDLGAVRSYLAANNAHGDYSLTPALARLPAEGCLILEWHNRTVSLICLDGGKGKEVFLFVINRSDLADPPAFRQFAKLGKLATASWTDGPKTYVLATGDEQFLRSLL